MKISPFGQTGPAADDPATDLTLLYASGIARLLTGQVDDLAEPPIRPVGEQSAFIGGWRPPVPGCTRCWHRQPGAVDVSMQEALATLAMTELARAGLTGRAVAQAADRRQWCHGLHFAGERRLCRDLAARGPAMGGVAGGDGLARLGPRSSFRQQSGSGRALGCAACADVGMEPAHDKQWIADTAQAAHVPSFPLRNLSEHLTSPQLQHRRFWRGDNVRMPAAPFGLTLYQVPASRLEPARREPAG